MELNKEIFERELIKHKKTMAQLNNIKEPPTESTKALFAIFSKIRHQAQELSLALSNCKCQRCGKEEDLSFHHLVMRKAKDFMPFDRYLSARHYYSNIIILCWDCHHLYHTVLHGKEDKEESAITPEKIEKVKMKFFT